MTPNERLRAYLRSLGLSETATPDETQTYFTGLRGMEASIANVLNYSEGDEQARTTCDLALRAFGVDPVNPSVALTTEPTEPSGTTDGGLGNVPVTDPAAIQRARAEGQESEMQRRSSIERLTALSGSSEEFTRGLLNNPNLSVEDATEVIFTEHQNRTRHTVPVDVPSGVPAGHVRNSGTIDLMTAQAVGLYSRGLDPMTQFATNDNGTPRVRAANEELEQAAENAYAHRAASLEDQVRMCAQIDGVTLPMGRVGLLENYMRAGSTAALSAVFTTNVNSELLAGHAVAEDSTGGGWVRESDVSDFRTNERARMENGGALQKLPRGGEADHATYTDTVESFKIARYAKKFVIDDQDIQDDNFGGISGFVPFDMGVAAGQVRPDLVYSLLLANAVMRDAVALFHASHGNLNPSAALAIATLKAGRSAMRLQTEGVRNLNIVPKYLLVPPTLESDADTLLMSNNIVSGNTTGLVENNPNAGKGIQVVSDSRLENGVTDPTDGTGATVHAGSASTWFLSAAAQAHTIEVAYLRGTGRVPQVRPFVLTQGKWGLGWDVKMDLGAKAIDWRGLQKNTA